MRRRGERALSPREQKQIRTALKSVGAPDDLEFDRYEQRIPWSD